MATSADRLDGHLLPGWYPVAGNPSAERFWNGRAWTELERSVTVLADYLGPIEPILAAILDAEPALDADLTS